MARRLTRRCTTGSQLRLSEIPEVVALRHAHHLGERVDGLDAAQRRELYWLLSLLLPPSAQRSGDVGESCFECDTRVGREQIYQGDCFHCAGVQGQRAILRRMLRAV